MIEHGARRLPTVFVDDYSTDILHEDSYFGDKASIGAFRELIATIRDDLAAMGEDPIDVPTDRLSKKAIDAILLRGEPREAAVIHSAVEAFARNVAKVATLLLGTARWKDVTRIAVGGGFRYSRVGEIVIGRAEIIAKAEYPEIEIEPIRHHPDEAGLIGAVQLAPRSFFNGYDSILAVDIGGSNFRAGIVDLNLKKANDFSKARIWKSELWRHADDGPTREEAMERLEDMLVDLIAQAKKKQKRLAPFIGVGCPGTVKSDGSLEGGTLNLPGDWSDGAFNLVDEITAMAPRIGDEPTTVVLHNDAVVHGLSEAPFMRLDGKWAVLTIGTGLGNACFRNRPAPGE